MLNIHTQRLTAADRAQARAMFLLMAAVFEEPGAPLSDAYLDRLLARADFWAIAAFVDGAIAGGITAHTLWMTRAQSAEILVYDLAVRPELQRRGIGQRLIAALRQAAAREAITNVFVDAENEDTHALDFYRGIGGAAAPVTQFTFGS
jgi:aminoglycoside 3-N-acetyltransferase I